MCIFVSSGFFRRFDKIPTVFCAELLNSRGLQICPHVPDIGKMELPNQFDIASRPPRGAAGLLPTIGCDKAEAEAQRVEPETETPGMLGS